MTSLRARVTRTAVIGSRSAAASLADELEASRVTGFALVGRIGPAAAGPGDTGWLGSLADLHALVDRYDIDLLLFGSSVSRIAVFDELARLGRPASVRVLELSAFYEQHFGHVPIADINSAWFQCVLHPRYRDLAGWPKRAFDLAVCLLLGLLFLPVLAVLVLLIRRDGGAAFYRQERIGKDGRSFMMVKLRTMRAAPPGAAPWTQADDDRVTPIGRFLRRAHLDELPQLLNVLRGEMSIVGPRPEQPHYVAQLEQLIPFYSWRQQLRPGLTGWAQIHCGYAGSERGTAWKVSHDLYYLKHGSLLLDASILLRTATSVARRPQFAEPRPLPFVFGVPPEPAQIGMPAEADATKVA
jgi:exopolysaccharide biosynthesis polyprenyl glycosylphosphotransferase